MIATGAHIQCSAQARPVFTRHLKAASKDPDSTLAGSPSAAIREAVALEATSITTASTKTPLSSQIRHRRPADAFLAGRVIPSDLSEPISLGPIAFGKGQGSLRDELTLISVGPNTDAVIDRFNLGDRILPELRVLARTIRSSRWEAILRSSKWDLPYEQASVLSKALLADLQGMPVDPEIVKVGNLLVFWAPSC
jgi:hypothetical protein